MPTLSLQPDDARLVYLATVYHLGRPGSEIDPATLQRHGLGLASVREALAPQLGRANAEVEVTPYQLERLGVALHGIVNELKQYELADHRSAVPGFAEGLHEAFEDADEPGVALDLAQQAVMLRRRLDAVVRDAEAQLAAARAEATQTSSAGGARRAWWLRLARRASRYLRR